MAFITGCVTPNGVSGKCTSLFDCDPLYELLKIQPISTSVRKFLRASQCSTGTGKSPYVCCNPNDGYKPPQESIVQLSRETNFVDGKIEI